MPKVVYTDGDEEKCDRIEVNNAILLLYRDNQQIRTSEIGTVDQIL